MEHFLTHKYGLVASEARRLEALGLEALKALLGEVETWREGIGLPAPSSPLVRGYLIHALARVEAQRDPLFTVRKQLDDYTLIWDNIVIQCRFQTEADAWDWAADMKQGLRCNL